MRSLRSLPSREASFIERAKCAHSDCLTSRVQSIRGVNPSSETLSLETGANSTSAFIVESFVWVIRWPGYYLLITVAHCWKNKHQQIYIRYDEFSPWILEIIDMAISLHAVQSFIVDFSTLESGDESRA